MCTRAHGGELSPLDVKRALAVDAITHKRAKKLMNRLHLTRKVCCILLLFIFIYLLLFIFIYLYYIIYCCIY